MKLAPLMSSVNQGWDTPSNLLELVRKLGDGAISLDPCTNDSNPTGALRFFTPASDGLFQSWAGPGLVYANPPYGRALKAWARKFADEGKRCELVALTPARPDTRWFQDSIITAAAICFWRGRLRFVGAPDPAPFPSAISYWGPRVDEFAQVFGDYGWIVQP